MSQIEAAGPGVQSPDAEQEQAPIWGSIISADNGSIDMDCPSGNVYEGEVIVNISGDTLILDGENGYPLEAEELQAGETVYAYIGPAMTMSLPPQTTGRSSSTSSTSASTRPSTSRPLRQNMSGKRPRGPSSSRSSAPRAYWIRR